MLPSLPLLLVGESGIACGDIATLWCNREASGWSDDVMYHDDETRV